jgi:hypothetical protein
MLLVNIRMSIHQPLCLCTGFYVLMEMHYKHYNMGHPGLFMKENSFGIFGLRYGEPGSFLKGFLLVNDLGNAGKISVIFYFLFDCL